MVESVQCRTGTFFDSVTLLKVSRTVAAVEGVEAALVAMATPLNLDLLAQMGFTTAPPDDAGPNDLLVAMRAAGDRALDAGLATLEASLVGVSGPVAPGALGTPPRTFAAAVRTAPADLALISVPGEHAFTEAIDALEAGLHVMVFSDNVSVACEVALKRRARELDRLVMGPDAGTALVAGAALGFANAVRPGPVGVVAASGTGAQQLACLLDDHDVGVSHILGVGGRDLTEAVGAASTLQALVAMDADPATELIVVVSKPAPAAVQAVVREAVAALATPGLVAVVGPGAPDLTQVAADVVSRLGGMPSPPASWPGSGASAGPGGVLGLFSGGTLAHEAAAVLEARLGDGPTEVSLLDLGDDEYTRGRAHPMIDGQLRAERILAQGSEPGWSVLLVDVVLGWGAHPDPAGELAPVLAEVQRRRREAGRPELALVVSLCGTAADPQGREAQVRALQGVGASVHLSNAAAAHAAADLVEVP